MLQKVIADDLKVGMFVADLDRPWMDTPFLLQGFMLENNEQIVEVRAHCQWVLVDPLRSIGAEFEVLQAKKTAPKPVPKRDLGNEPRVTVYRAEAPKVKTIDELRAERVAPQTKSNAKNTAESLLPARKKNQQTAVR